MKRLATIIAFVWFAVMATAQTITEAPVKFLYGEPPVATFAYQPLKSTPLPRGLGSLDYRFGAGATLDRNIPVYSLDVMWTAKFGITKDVFAYAGLVGPYPPVGGDACQQCGVGEHRLCDPSGCLQTLRRVRGRKRFERLSAWPGGFADGGHPERPGKHDGFCQNLVGHRGGDRVFRDVEAKSVLKVRT